MKKTTIIYLMMFVLAFILPSFTYPQEDEDKGKVVQKTSDSLVVKVRFQNPEVIVTDSRTNEDLEKKFDLQTMSNAALIDELKTLNNNFYVFFTSMEERRCESVMDRIKRASGYTEGQINKIFKQERTINTIRWLTAILTIIAMIVIYNTSFRRLRGLIAVPLSLCLLIGIIIIVLSEFLLPSLYGLEYQTFFQLLKHIPQ